MATIDKQYWQDRSTNRLVNSEKIGLNAFVNIQDILSQAQDNIGDEIEAVYRNYAVNGILNVSDLKKTLTSSEQQKFLDNVREKALKLGIDPDTTFDNRYLFRLTRLKALEVQVQLETMTIAPQEVTTSTTAYKKIIRDSYADAQNSFASAGFMPAFATLDTDIINIIVRSQWAGGNYSSRIWGNTTKLAQILPNLIGGGMSSGLAAEKIVKQVNDIFNVGQSNSLRLVRTETNYFNNQSELQSYTDDSIDEYEFDAILDERTSAICESLNGQVFKVAEAVVGENFPPMLPNCRSSTSPVFNGETYKGSTGLTMSSRALTRDERVARYTQMPSNVTIKNQYADKIVASIAL